jgi:alpha-tubulin suppressor-like RCC1 family protein
MNEQNAIPTRFEQEEEEMRRAIELSKQDALKFVRTKSIEQKQQIKKQKTLEAKTKPKKEEAPKASSVSIVIPKTTESHIYAWGDNSRDQLGIGARNRKICQPTLMTAKFQIEKIACGADHTLCLTQSGLVYYWGQYYQTTKENEKERTGLAKHPKLMESLAQFVTVDIAAGSGHNLAVTESKDLYSWGVGKNGELGIAE